MAVSTFVVAMLARSRPWLWAFRVGVWVPAFTLASGGDPAAMAALGFAVLGAYAGYGLTRVMAA